MNDIKQLRLAASLEQTELAEHAGLCSATISRIETGRTPVSYNVAVKISRALKKLDPDQFDTLQPESITTTTY